MSIAVIEPEASRNGISFDSSRVPDLIAAAGEGARIWFLELFGSAIRNPHTRRAYLRAVSDFLASCETINCEAVPSRAPPSVRLAGH